MAKKTAYLLLSFFFFTVAMHAQEIAPAPMVYDKVNLGIGGGLDYGGFGADLMFYPHQSVGLFAGAGYAIAGFGFNAGVKYRFIPKKQPSGIAPYAMAMYGYNAAIAVADASQFNKLFYGPTFGAGLDFGLRPGKRGYWSVALLVPIRSSEAKEYVEDLEENEGVEFSIGLLPVAFSIGYRFILR
ncbi:MAG: hypothetical protein MUC78_03920 [Bacteroidales bacterium]|jgi:hypothetical protein|nr:hypothetical protein [Bacteroidales bacterium]